MLEKINVLITGGAGFIGSSLIDLLLENGNYNITCIDNFDPFYDKNVKNSNIKNHITNGNYKLIEADINDLDKIYPNLDSSYDIIVHLAAKAGVRPSILNPILYQQVNVVGLQSILAIAKEKKVKQFIFGSSSSVYGLNSNIPWSESDNDLKPISPYAASKIAGEWVGKAFCQLHNIRFIALRFFTVYGPKQRPDLAINNFTHKIINDIPIDFFGDGSTLRDYTYIDDIVNGIVSSMHYSKSNFEIINLGNNTPVTLTYLLSTIEEVIGKKAIVNHLPNQPGDVPATFANITKANNLLNYTPTTELKVGVEKFVKWKINGK